MNLVNLPKCAPADQVDTDFDLLNNCEEAVVQNNTPSGTEWPVGHPWTHANPKDPDTDNDGIIDGLEILTMGFKIGYALDNRVNQIYEPGGNLTAFRKIQLHRNPVGPDDGALEYDTRVKLLNVMGDGRSCYTFEQSKLQLFPVDAVEPANTMPYLVHGQNENVVLVYYIQTKFKDQGGKGVYMYSFQKLKADKKIQDALGPNSGLQVNDSVFTPYNVFTNAGSGE